MRIRRHSCYGKKRLLSSILIVSSSCRKRFATMSEIGRADVDTRLFTRQGTIACLVPSPSSFPPYSCMLGSRKLDHIREQMLHVDNHSRFRLTAMHRMRTQYADWRARYAHRVPRREINLTAHLSFQYRRIARAHLAKVFNLSAAITRNHSPSDWMLGMNEASDPRRRIAFT